MTERPGVFRLRTGKCAVGLSQARNVLTQRMTGPDCAGEVTLDGCGLKDGDYAGLCAYQGCFGLIALTRENGQYFLSMRGKPAKNETIYGDFDYAHPGVEYARIPADDTVVRLRVEADFSSEPDLAEFFYQKGSTGSWQPLGIAQKLYFKMDYFTGCRFGLFYYSTEEYGGTADFLDFKYFSSKYAF